MTEQNNSHRESVEKQRREKRTCFLCFRLHFKLLHASVSFKIRLFIKSYVFNFCFAHQVVNDCFFCCFLFFFFVFNSVFQSTTPHICSQYHFASRRTKLQGFYGGLTILDCTLGSHFVIHQIEFFLIFLFDWTMNLWEWLGPGNEDNARSLQSVTLRSILR